MKKGEKHRMLTGQSHILSFTGKDGKTPVLIVYGVGHKLGDPQRQVNLIFGPSNSPILEVHGGGVVVGDINKPVTWEYTQAGVSVLTIRGYRNLVEWTKATCQVCKQPHTQSVTPGARPFLVGHCDNRGACPRCCMGGCPHITPSAELVGGNVQLRPSIQSSF